MSDNQTLMSDLHGDLEGLFRKTIRTIVDNRSQAFTKVMRIQVKGVEDKAVASIRELNTNDRPKLSLEERKRRKQHRKGASKGVKVPKETSVTRIVKRSRWMITYTRLETAPPLPDLETYIQKNEDWFGSIAKDLEGTPSNRKYGHGQYGQKLRIPNRVNWSAATVRKKTHMEGNDPVATERISVYVEFDFPVTQSDMQTLAEKWFAIMSTTNGGRLKIRVWDGSDPVEQIHTRDPTSVVELTKHIQIVGDHRRLNPLQSNSSIGTSGRRPLASDPHAMHSNRICTERWNGLIGNDGKGRDQSGRRQKSDQQVKKAK
jgi:hypothetical protein